MQIQQRICKLDAGSLIANDIVMNYTTSEFFLSGHTQALVDGDCGNQANAAFEASICDLQEESRELHKQFANIANSQENLQDK